MTPNIIYGEKEINIVETTHMNTFRTNFIISSVKNCFEATYISGCNYRHIGFSPFSNIRSFISFTVKDSSAYFLEYKDDTSYDTQYNVNTALLETMMVCLDTENSSFMMIFNNQTSEYKYSHIENTKKWYAMIDAGNTCSNTNSVKFSINLGIKRFQNNIPNGFYPFVNGYLNILASKYRKMQSCRNSRHRPTFFYFLTLVIVIS